MTKIQKNSSHLLILFNTLLILVPLLTLVQWLSMRMDNPSGITQFFRSFTEVIQTPEGPINLNFVHWTPVSSFLALCAQMLGILPFLLSLLILKSIFKNYAQGEIFTKDNARCYRMLGILFLIDAFGVQPLKGAMMIFAISLTNPPGHRYLSISFGTPNLIALFYGILVIVASWVMLEASKLQEEQRLTI